MVYVKVGKHNFNSRNNYDSYQMKFSHIDMFIILALMKKVYVENDTITTPSTPTNPTRTTNSTYHHNICYNNHKSYLNNNTYNNQSSYDNDKT